jgi:hypothetical protein
MDKERGDTPFVTERRRSRRLQSAIRAPDVRAADLQEATTRRDEKRADFLANSFLGSDEDGGSPANTAASGASHETQRAQRMEQQIPCPRC